MPLLVATFSAALMIFDVAKISNYSIRCINRPDKLRVFKVFLCRSISSPVLCR
jgi:hypothetical protein